MNESERKVERIDVWDYRSHKSMPGRRLDGYLAAKFTNYSRSFITSLIRDGKVTINGKPVKPHYDVKRGDQVHVELPVHVRETLAPENIPIEILHEDDYILIINKPADILVHPAKGGMTGTLVNALVYYCDTLPDTDEGDRTRPGIIHRLDRDTTGVMIVVKAESARGWIGKQFESRKVKKFYLAVVEGEPELDSDLISLPLGRHRTQREKMSVDRVNGREAVSIYTVVERFEGFALVRVELKTGRTHQIRVHMAAVGHPVVCDGVYGRREDLYLSDLTRAPHVEGEEPIISRQALHAESISFCHPGTKAMVTYFAPLAPDMERLLAALREQRPRK